MKINKEHFYFYLGWNGLIIAFFGTIFGKYIDVQLDWTIYIEKELEEL